MEALLFFLCVVCSFFYKISILGSNAKESILRGQQFDYMTRKKKNAHPRVSHAQLESETSYFSKRLECNSLPDVRGRMFGI